jgi:glutathione S-transferase
MESAEPKLVLYSYFRSSTAWRVRIALNLLKITPEYKFVHLVKGDQKSEEFEKVNPNKVTHTDSVGCPGVSVRGR